MSVRNYRLYFVGQLISTSGTWMQSIAQAWLVFQLTGSGVALGVTTALQFTPMLLAGAWGGVLADRVEKRRLLIGTQAASGLLALVLGAVTGNLTASDRVEVRSEGSLTGDVSCQRISIEDGAFFKGGIDVRKPVGKENGSAHRDELTSAMA